MALFAAIVDRLDKNVGRVMEHLQDIGVEYAVVFSGDTAPPFTPNQEAS